jgi:hypothetical protein
MAQAIESKVLRPAFQPAAAPALSLRNEGSRTIQIIGDAVPDGAKVLPGDAFAILQPGGPVQLTFYDGGVQVDFVR